MDLPLDRDALRRIGSSGEQRTAFIEQLINELTGFDSEDPPLGSGLLRLTDFDEGLRDEGLDWPATALTMVGRRRLHNYCDLIDSVIANGVEGDLVETGVWRGGASLLARIVLALSDDPRAVILADSFEGLPSPDVTAYPRDKDSKLHDLAELAISLDEVRQNFESYGMLDDQVRFVKGWFRDTMPVLQVDKVAVLRLDGDMYESTIDPLRHLYDKITHGGYVIIDDYVHPPCRDAVSDFCESRDISPEIHAIDRVGSYFRVEQLDRGR